MEWHTKALLLCCSSAALFLTTLGLLVAASIHGDFTASTRLYQGQCSTAGHVSMGIHAIIAVASFVVTVSSDTFLRFVVAPQPEDVRRAHAQREYLDIGVNSIRNLRFLSRRRVWLWAVLLGSSIPVQLFFHASIFLTSTSTDYRQIMVGQGFVDGSGRWAIPGVAFPGDAASWVKDNSTFYTMVKEFQASAAAGNWTRLEADLCQNTYNGPLNGLRDYRDLILVVEEGPSPPAAGWTIAEMWNELPPPFYSGVETSSYHPYALNTLWSLSQEPTCATGTNASGSYNTCLGSWGQVSSASSPSGSNQWGTGWMYGFLQDPPPQVRKAFNETNDNFAVRYCLAEPFIAPCKVEVTNLLLAAVCVCILVKTIGAVIALIRLDKSKPVHCLGDLVQLYLQQGEDPTTARLCMYGQDWFRAHGGQRRGSRQGPGNMRRPSVGAPPIAWKISSATLTQAIPAGVRAWTALWLIIGGAVGLSLTIRAYNTGRDAGDWWEYGFGSSPNNVQLHLARGRVGTAILANIIQVLLTPLVFWYTSLFSRVTQAKDWAQFAQNPQPLRVSAPEHQTQETYYLLGFPLAWGLTGAVYGAVLHWVTSQALYATAQETLPAIHGDPLATPLRFGLAFSLPAMLVGLLMVFIPFGLLGILFRKKLPAASIIVGSNSAAISAQCHRPRDHSDHSARSDGLETKSIVPHVHDVEQQPPSLWCQKLAWGVLVHGSTSPGRPGQLGLAAAESVLGNPVEGHYYQ